MAVTDLWVGADKQPTARHGRGKRWRVRVAGHPSRAFATKFEAQAWERELLRRGTPTAETSVTVGELVALHLAGKEHLTKDAVGALKAARVRVLQRWEHVPVGEVQRAQVQAWVAGMTSQHGPRREDGTRALRPAAAATRAKALQVLAGAMRIALEQELVDRDPTAGVTVGKQRTVDPRFLDVVELRRLAEEAGVWAPMVWLMGTTGVRIGECARLDGADVDVARSRVRVRRSKSGRGRDVPLTPQVLAMLELDDGPLFRSPQGERVDPDNWRTRVFHPATERAGLAPLRPHDLRHTAASLMIASGASVKDVQYALGHASAKMTLDLYSHRFANHLTDVTARMSGLLDG